MSNRIELAADYWDCECEDGFIHKTTVNDCPRCGAGQEEQPNSRLNEVAEYLGIPINTLRTMI